ncbi:hypothetical protein RB195_016436 [Necator americanus]|uniref:Core-2/I-Branching enzyme n=1 Tax=Necator americanus TaxID=51031 RepID=A0ABR1C3P2_NECAM
MTSNATALIRFRARPYVLYSLIILVVIIPFVLYLDVISLTTLSSLFTIDASVWQPKAIDFPAQLIDKKPRKGEGAEERKQHEKPVKFLRRPETAHIECDRVLRDEKGYVETVAKNRTTLVVHDFDMTCAALRKRIFPPKRLRPLKFGIAFARIVYESYEFIEDELRSSYHQQNVFCYSIDIKASELFNSRIKMLEKCFPNVVVTTVSFDINSSGRFMNHAYYECLKLLVDFQGWGYVLLMQNYDVMIKTVYETVAILNTLEGANDVHIRPCEDYRWDHSAKWDARSLKLYRNETLATPKQLNATLTMARGAVHASLSRAAVEWMVNTVDLTVLLDQLNTGKHGIDEVLIPTLQVSEIFDMPGRFTAECVKKGHVIGFITRIEIWAYDKLTSMCGSKKFRHAVCIYGIEDLSWLSRHPKIIANKMMSNFDYSIVDCMHELIFNRTHLGQVNDALNLTIYEKQPYVRYHKNRIRPDPKFKLDCSFGI